MFTGASAGAGPICNVLGSNAAAVRVDVTPKQYSKHSTYSSRVLRAEARAVLDATIDDLHLFRFSSNEASRAATQGTPSRRLTALRPPRGPGHGPSRADASSGCMYSD